MILFIFTKSFKTKFRIFRNLEKQITSKQIFKILEIYVDRIEITFFLQQEKVKIFEQRQTKTILMINLRKLCGLLNLKYFSHFVVI